MQHAGPSPTERLDIDCEQCHPILAVPDVREAVDFYTKRLGFWLAFAEGDPPTFAGVNLGRVQVFLEHGTPSPQGCSVYFVVSDADKLHRFHRSRGVTVLESPADRPYSLRDYTVQDACGYRLTFGHRLPSRVAE
jgi:catechol 2,3-dioxygenase-like lactoylglutathione lyase family enzyme